MAAASIVIVSSIAHVLAKYLPGAPVLQHVDDPGFILSPSAPEYPLTSFTSWTLGLYSVPCPLYRMQR